MTSFRQFENIIVLWSYFGQTYFRAGMVDPIWTFSTMEIGELNVWYILVYSDVVKIIVENFMLIIVAFINLAASTLHIHLVKIYFHEHWLKK